MCMCVCVRQAAKLKTNAPNRLAETTFVNRIFGGYLRSQVSQALSVHGDREKGRLCSTLHSC